MTTKPDRKSMLRSSIKNETQAVDQRFEPANIDKRYDAADNALVGRPLQKAARRAISARKSALSRRPSTKRSYACHSLWSTTIP